MSTPKMIARMSARMFNAAGDVRKRSNGKEYKSAPPSLQETYGGGNLGNSSYVPTRSGKHRNNVKARLRRKRAQA